MVTRRCHGCTAWHRGPWSDHACPTLATDSPSSAVPSPAFEGGTTPLPRPRTALEEHARA